MNNFFNKFITFPRILKRLIVILSDLIIIFLTFYIFENIFTNQNVNSLIFLLFALSSVLIFYFFNVYNNVIRFISFKSISNLAFGLSFPFILYGNIYSQYTIFSIKILLIIYVFTLSLLFLIRLIARSLLYKITDKASENISIFLNYDSEFDMATSIVKNFVEDKRFNLVSIVSDNSKYINLLIGSVKVVDFSMLENLINDKKISILFIPSKFYSNQLKNDLYKIVSKYPLKVVEIPDIDHYMSGKDNLNILKNLSIDDIVDRSIKDNIEVDKNFFKNKNVLVTGGGGSIGSVLCEEIAKNNPKKIIILDNSEFQLFKISEIFKNYFPQIDFKICLLDLKDKDSLENFFKKNKVDIIYHAAAYKHVYLVEKNIFSGVANNIFSFINLIDISIKMNIKYFTLISTDKAVSPSTVMGMTKRICEMILFDRIKNTELNYSAVRFGNVFNSSGSVISIFKKQIQKGEDLTLTDPNATRYFMSIREAANLVIKSSLISKGGELFILDMGEPLKILDVAKKMIHLSGKTIKNDSNPKGEIGIKITGLLPSEKMHEELSQTDLIPTSENKIFLSNDLSKDLTDFDFTIKYFIENMDNDDKLILKLKEIVSS